MNKEDLILQKLESMDAELKNVRSEMKDGFNSVDSEMKDGFNRVDSELKEIREDSTEMKVNQTRHGGKLETLEMKLDAFIDNMRDRKADTNERWKISGIIISCGVALVSLILSILTRLGR